ncbi:MAG: hypothetical protein LBS24_07395 [Clostridiales Family XIII bacterium]|nr:hypothetical protein [Clostridiales Family XIII bacterium]
MATNRPRYTVSVDEDMFKKIEDFRYKQRYPTRSEATVELIRIGLAVLRGEMTEEDRINKKIEEDVASYRQELESEARSGGKSSVSPEEKEA